MQKVSRGGNFSKSGRKWDLEDFCEMGMNLRLLQNLKLSWNSFAKLKMDLEYFCPKRREERNWT